MIDTRSTNLYDSSGGADSSSPDQASTLEFRSLEKSQYRKRPSLLPEMTDGR